ncbi:importin-alpha export receptor [Borealophlyctis nickersoniae]|nr:importin-alpha export receptor [Borealophlyctis nickersoniae]
MSAGAPPELEENEQTYAALAAALQQTLDPALETRKQAEQTLLGVEKSQKFSVLLLALVSNNGVDLTVRKAGALYFKNFVKKYWKQTEGEEDKVAQKDREAIKGRIVQDMISTPPAIQAQLSEAVSLIADNDFPMEWDTLMQDLLSRLNTQDYNVNIGVLQTAHSIFRRYRHQFPSERLFFEIKTVLDAFAPAYLGFFQATDALIDQNADKPEALKPLFAALLLIVKIFYSLNSQDLPEFFEDHHEEFMTLLHKYLVYTNPLLASPSEDEAGPLEKVKAAICEIILMYASKYEEDFKILPQFVTTVWSLLTTTGLEPRNDLLVSKAISFLTVVVKKAKQKSLFESEETLRLICEKVVLPNLTLRESDEEQFEDDPIEFIRRDLEGDDTETRRRAAADLVKGLLDFFKGQITQICSGYVTLYLENYAKDTKANWKSKDAALYLITSLSAQSSTVQTGVTQTNELIPIMPVLTGQVLPDLEASADAAIHPIIKVDAIKYLILFRSQLSKEQLTQLFPALLNHLGSENYVVHTYAAVGIERILAMKAETKMMFNQADIAPVALPLINRLFDLIERGRTPEKLAENDYLMKTVVRVIATARDDLLPAVTSILERQARIIEEISKNPSNPKFNHYVFEGLGALIRFICAKNPALVTNFEDLLFPRFETILRGDVAEFLPYVFQLCGQMLDYHDDEGIPQKFQSLLVPILHPSLWESHGNVPALVKLLKSYLNKGPTYLVEQGLLQQALGVSRKLLGSKLHEHYGFELLEPMFENIPTVTLAPYVKAIFHIFLTRLMTSRTQTFGECFLRFMCFLFVLPKEGWNVDVVVATMDEIQPNIFAQLLQSILIPELGKLKSVDDRKLGAVGVTKLLTESEKLLQPPYINLWPSILVAVVDIADNPISRADEDEELVFEVQDDVGYQATYVKLAATATKKRDPVAHIPDSRAFLVQALAAFAGRKGTQTPSIASLPDPARDALVEKLVQWAQAANLPASALLPFMGQTNLA